MNYNWLYILVCYLRSVSFPCTQIIVHICHFFNLEYVRLVLGQDQPLSLLINIESWIIIGWLKSRSSSNKLYPLIKHQYINISGSDEDLVKGIHDQIAPEEGRIVGQLPAFIMSGVESLKTSSMVPLLRTKL